MPVNDKIWITSKTRVQSEARLLRYERLSHIVLSYYSAFMIAYAVLSIGDESKEKQYLQIVMSLAVFAASLISYGFKFGDQAKQYRECYLELDDLYNSSISQEKKAPKYGNILAKYPNHTNFDFYTMLKNARKLGRMVNDSGGSPIEVSWDAALLHWLTGFFLKSAVVGLYAFPIWALVVIFWPAK